MTRIEVGSSLIACAMHLRALAEWLTVNHDTLEQSTLAFFSAYMLELSRHAQVVAYLLAPTEGDPVLSRRCIFY